MQKWPINTPEWYSWCLSFLHIKVRTAALCVCGIGIDIKYRHPSLPLGLLYLIPNPIPQTQTQRAAERTIRPQLHKSKRSSFKRKWWLHCVFERQSCYKTYKKLLHLLHCNHGIAPLAKIFIIKSFYHMLI